MSRLVRSRWWNKLLLPSKAIYIGIVGRVWIVLMSMHHRRSILRHVPNLHALILVFIWPFWLLGWVLLHRHCHWIHLLWHHWIW